jgi:hypothetical protein
VQQNSDIVMTKEKTTSKSATPMDVIVQFAANPLNNQL